MVSWSGTFLEWAIWAKFRATHAATDDQILEAIRSGWPAESSPEIIPSFIANASDLTSTKDVFKGPTQTWEVIRVDQSEDAGKKESDKVVVYWHGGAFKNRPSPYHYKVLRRLATEFSCSTVLPRYSLLPLTTANEWAINAVPFIFSIADDPRYAGKEIVLMGDSAGGFMTLRLLEVMCEIALGERGNEAEREKAKEVMKRMGKGVMFSATVDSELTKETEEWAPKDFWLNTGLFRIVSKMWSYGPAAFPDTNFNLPADHKPLPGDAKPITDPTYSPRYGMQVFARYRKAFPENRKIHLAAFIAKHDMLFPANERMAETLREIGPEAVTFDYHVEEGLYHVYAIIDLFGGIPEYRRAWAALEKMLM